MAQEKLILQVDKKPAYFNKDTLLGALVGSILPLGLISVVGGAVVGGAVGYNRMRDEQVHGKEVREPTALNKDALIGGLLGFVGTQLIAGLALLATAAYAPETFTKSLIDAGPITVTLGAIAISALAGVTGAFIGGASGKKEMQQEYIQAVAQAQSQARAKETSLEPQLAVDEPQISYTQKILQERERAGQPAIAR